VTPRCRRRALGTLVLSLLAFAAAPAMAQAPLIAGAGDIACDPASRYFRSGWGAGSGSGTRAFCKQRATSGLLSGADTVFTLGDNQYEHGSLSNFRRSYDRSWGRFKSRTRPAIGNHEYGPEVACGPLRCPTFRGSSGHYDYFGRRAGPRGKAYYSYNLGTWHVVVLNSMCGYVGGCDSRSPQGRWLRRDLAATRTKCILAYWHHPPFSSGESRGYPYYYDSFWRALQAKGTDAVLVGHDHVYERFAPQNEDGSPTARVNGHRGPRQFMVGTGGKNIGRFVTRRRNSVVRRQSHGVLRLRLRRDSYTWKFVRIDGRTGDSGSASCHA